MTAVEWLVSELRKPNIDNFITHIIHKALEIEKQQKKQIVLNLLYHDLGHDDTARWIAERLEAGEIDVNDL